MDIRDKSSDGFWDGSGRMGQMREHELNPFPSGSTSSCGSQLQYDNDSSRNLNFATVAMDEGEYGFPKKKTIRDPLSHRIIEKRRRDRMNNCLADLARLLPQASLRKGRGRIEKTEIVELAIKHLRHLQTHPCPHGDSCELNPMKPSGKSSTSSGPRLNLPILITPTSNPCPSTGSQVCRPQISLPLSDSATCEAFQQGFQECMTEALRFLLESKCIATLVNDMDSYTKVCRQLVQHLNQHGERILRENANKKRKLSNGFPSQGSDVNEFNQKLCSGSSVSPGYRPNGTSSAGSDGNGANDGELGHTISMENSPRHSSSYFNDHERSGLDCDVDNHSSSSTPLSIEVSDAMSSDGRNTCNGHSSNMLSVPQMAWEKRSPVLRSPGCPTIRATNSNCRSSDEGQDILSPTSHRYKFKNTIKQRFTADTQTKTEPDTESNSSFSKLDHNIPSCEDRARDFPDNEPEISRDNRDQIISSPSSEGMPEMSTCRNAFIPRVSVVDIASLAECEPDVGANPPQNLSTRGVPAFVLHTNGSYYIPLTLDRSALPDDACLEDFDDMSFTSPPFPLHPVTISVCYTTAKETSKQACSRSRNEKKLSSTNLAVSPVVIRGPSPKVVEIVNEVPRADPNFIMNRFEQSQIEAARLHHLQVNSATVGFRHSPDYRHLNLNHNIYNPCTPKVDNQRRVSLPESRMMHLAAGSTLLRKDPNSAAKSAFVGYTPWRTTEGLTVPADLSSKRRNSANIFNVEMEHPDMPNIKSRKMNSMDFHPRILSLENCSARHKLPKDIRE